MAMDTPPQSRVRDQLDTDTVSMLLLIGGIVAAVLLFGCATVNGTEVPLPPFVALGMTFLPDILELLQSFFLGT